MLGLVKTIVDNWSEVAFSTEYGDIHYSMLSKNIIKYIKHLQKIQFSSEERIGIKTKHGDNLTAFVLACIFTNKNVVIIPNDISNADYKMLLLQTKCTLVLVDSAKDIVKSSETTRVGAWLNLHSWDVIIYNDLLFNINKYNEIKNNIIIEDVTTTNFEKTISSLILNENTTVVFVSPGIREGLKLLQFKVSALEAGLRDVLTQLGISEEKKVSLAYGEIFPYTFIISVLYPLFNGGKVVFIREGSRRALDLIEFEKVNFLLTHVEIFRSIISHIMPTNRFLKRLLLWYRFMPYRKTLEQVILFGKLDHETSSNFNKLGINFTYSYLLSEVASFVSLKKYKKLPLKKLTTGKPIYDLKIKSENSKSVGEININSPAEFSGYLYTERNKLKEHSSSFKGYFRTFDFGFFKNEELVVMGHYSELYRNEHGLTIQEGLIKAILLSHQFINDLVLIVEENKIYALIELDVAYLTLKQYSLENVHDVRIPKVLKELNDKLKEFTKIKGIIVIPSQLIRKGGRVVSRQYNLQQLRSIESDLVGVTSEP